MQSLPLASIVSSPISLSYPPTLPFHPSPSLVICSESLWRNVKAKIWQTEGLWSSACSATNILRSLPLSKLLHQFEVTFDWFKDEVLWNGAFQLNTRCFLKILPSGIVCHPCFLLPPTYSSKSTQVFLSLSSHVLF